MNEWIKIVSAGATAMRPRGCFHRRDGLGSEKPGRTEFGDEITRRRTAATRLRILSIRHVAIAVHWRAAVESVFIEAEQTT